MFPDALMEAARSLLAACEARKLTIATAESCTGGLIAGLLTEIVGSSSVFERGYVTYANAAKEAMLGVPALLIERHGAVSEEVARAMVEGALTENSLALAVTGIAGPGGGTEQKPVGLVYIAAALHGRCVVKAYRFAGDRGAVRLQAVEAAVAMGLSLVMGL